MECKYPDNISSPIFYVASGVIIGSTIYSFKLEKLRQKILELKDENTDSSLKQVIQCIDEELGFEGIENTNSIVENNNKANEKMLKKYFKAQNRLTKYPVV
jgi:hypothetical protein